jgi:ATP-dependent DNA helicase RecG
LTTLKIHPQYIKQPKSQIESGVESGVESEPLRIQILHLLKEKEHSKKEMAISFGHKKTYRYLDETVRSLVEAQMIAYTIPDKPQSRLQEYRLTDKGRKCLEAKA